MALGTLSVCLNVLVLNFHHGGSTSRVPRWANVLLIQYVGGCFGLKYKRVGPPRVRECPNNYRATGTADLEGDTTEMMEVQNILPHTADKMRRSHHHHQDTYIINETMHYHNVELAQLKRSNMSRQDSFISEDQHESITKEWQMLAKVLDRLFFTIVFVTMFASACLILLSPWYYSPKYESNPVK